MKHLRNAIKGAIEKEFSSDYFSYNHSIKNEKRQKVYGKIENSGVSIALAKKIYDWDYVQGQILFLVI